MNPNTIYSVMDCVNDHDIVILVGNNHGVIGRFSELYSLQSKATESHTLPSKKVIEFKCIHSLSLLTYLLIYDLLISKL